MSATEEWLKSLADQPRREALRTSTMLRNTDPEKAAEARRVSSELGLPEPVVRPQLDVYRKQATQKRTADILSTAPKTAQWLSTLRNGEIAADDVEALSWFEKNVEQSGGAITRAIGRGVRRVQAVGPSVTANVSAGIVQDVGRSFDDLYADELGKMGYTHENAPARFKLQARQAAQFRFENFGQAGEASLQEAIRVGSEALQRADEILGRVQDIPMSDAATRFRDETLASADNSLLGVLSAFASDPAGGSVFLFETAAEVLPVLAVASGATAITRSPMAGALVMGTGSGLMEGTTEATQFLQEKGVDLSSPEAAAQVLTNPELMQEARDRGLTRGVIIGLFDAVSGGVAGQTLSKSPAGEVLLQGISQVLLGGGGEATAQYALDGELDWREIVVEGLAEFATLPVEVFGVGGRRVADFLRRGENSDAAAQRLQSIDDAAAQSKLKGRDPEAFRDFLISVGVGEVYVDASGLDEYFQAKDIDRDAFLDDLEIDPGVFDEAIETGGQVAIPESVYAARISGTDDAEWFKQHSRIEPDGMSQIEAARFNEEVQQVMTDAFEQAQEEAREELEMRASDQKVYDSVFSQLREAGRTRDVAANEARVWSAFWRTMGERYGADPAELAQAMGVQIRGPEQADPARRRGNLDMMLNTLRSQGDRALRPRGMSVTEFVREKGGVIDVGGDVAALDVPDGVIAETREQAAQRRSQPSLGGMPAERKGMGLDEMGRAVLEAGYFPDMMGMDGVNEADLLIEALRREASGDPVYVDGEGPDADMVMLADELSRRGIDLAAASNDEVAAALEQDADGQEYNQDGRLNTDTEAFRNWFGDSKVVDENGEPLVVYHGTSSDFGVFDKSAGSKHFQMPGFYFTADPDVADHYASSASRKEIRDADGYIEGFEDARIVPVYLSIQSPKILDYADEFGEATFERPARVRQDITDAQSEGYDGVIISNWRDGSISNQYVAFSPTQIKSVYNRGTFDPADPRILYQETGTKRGSIVLPSGGLTEGQTVINLFEGADLSTFLHESGHFFLEAFSALAAADDAPQSMKDDLAVIHKFLEVENSNQIGTPQHEKWARAFERYVMEGKAPSLELADAFARFKAWLVRIYETVRGLNVTLTDEVREVMDRMLATDAEIRAAREEARMSPLFTDQAAAGMSDAAWNTYQRMARRSSEQAGQKLLERAMADVRRKREAWWKEERAQVRKEVEGAVNSRREYRLIEALANERWIGSDRDMPDLRIDRKALVQLFGEGVLAEISRTRFGGKRAIYVEDGNAPAEVAEFFGFETVTQMIEVLQNTGKRVDQIELETDRIMSDRYGDPFSDGSIEEEALEAVHSEQRALTLASEVRHLLGEAGRETKGRTAKVYRQRARVMLGNMTVKDATRPGKFLEAERRAAKRAEDAFARVARGELRLADRARAEALTMAARHKEQQLLNHYLYLESRDLEKRVNSARDRVMRYRKETVRQKIGSDYIMQIDALLEDYDFRKKSPGQVIRAQKLAAFVDRMIEEGREAELNIDQRVIDEANRKHYSRLTVDEFNGLMDTIDNLDHLGRTKQMLIDRQRKRNLAESVSRVAGAIRASQPERDTKTVRRGLQAINLLSKPDTVMIRLDGGDEMGPVYDEIKRSIDEGASLEQKMHVEMAERFDGLFSEHYTRKQLREMHRVQKVPGITQEWTKQEIIALALNTGNENNFQRVMDRRVHKDRALTPEQLDALLSVLDKNDWRFVQDMWNLVNAYWPDLAAVHKRRTGVEPEKVEGRMMYGGAPAFVTGGYYPIAYDPSKGGRAARDEGSAWDRYLTAGHGARASVANGMTKQRQASGGGRTLLYDLSVPFKHLRETARFIALSEAVDASHRILNHEDVVAAFQDTGNADTLKSLNLWLRDVASGPIFNTDLANTFFRTVKNNFTISRLAFNMKTVILQVTGLGQSAATIGKKNMVSGLMHYWRHPQRSIASVLELSPLMQERQSTFQKDIYDFVNDTQNASPLASRWRKTKEGVAKAGFWPLVKMQFLVVDMPTWMGAFRAEMERSGDEAKAARFADRMVVRSQDSGLISDRSPVERGTMSETTRQADMVRIFTTLGGYMLTKLNRAYVTGIQARAGIRDADSLTGKMAVATSAAVDMTLLLAFEAIVMGAIWALIDDDEDDEDLRRFMVREVGAAMVGGIPLVRDAYAAFQGFGAGGVYGSVLEVPANLYKQAWEQGENDRGLRRAAGEMIGIATGLPSTATLRALEGALDNDVPMTEILFGRNPLDY